MKRWKIVALACLVVASMTILAACQSQDYKPSGKSQSVSASALGKDGTLRVGVNAASVPLAGQRSSSSRIIGIDVDIACYIADQMGCKVEIVDVGSDPEGALSDGKVDLVLGVDTADASGDYWKSITYIQNGVALFGSSSETAVPTVDSKPAIAAQSGSNSSWRVTNLFGDQSLVSQSDLKSAFEALKSGTARYVAAPVLAGTYVAYTNGYDAKIVAMLQDPSGYCALVSKSNTELQSAVSSAFDKLVNGGVLDVFESEWLGAPIDVSNVTVVKAASSDSSAASAAAAPAEGNATTTEDGAAA